MAAILFIKISKNEAAGRTLFLKRASKVFSKAARTAVFVSLYLSASN